MSYRVIQEFKVLGDPPSQAGLEHLRGRLDLAAPGAGAAIELGLCSMRVLMTFETETAEGAMDHARASAGNVFGGAAAHIQVEPGVDVIMRSDVGVHDDRAGPARARRDT